MPKPSSLSTSDAASSSNTSNLRCWLEGTVGDCAFRYATALFGASPPSSVLQLQCKARCFSRRSHRELQETSRPAFIQHHPTTKSRIQIPPTRIKVFQATPTLFLTPRTLRFLNKPRFAVAVCIVVVPNRYNTVQDQLASVISTNSGLNSGELGPGCFCVAHLLL